MLERRQLQPHAGRRALALLLALALALALALTTAGCAPTSPTSPAEEPAPERQPAPQPTALVMLFAGTEPGQPLPDQRPNPGAVLPDPGWRLSVVSLSTGEESVIATGSRVEDRTQRAYTLSPDGRRVLYGEYASPTTGYSLAYKLHVLDLETRETTRATDTVVDSWGWNGNTIVATVPHPPELMEGGARNIVSDTAVIEIFGSVTTTRVPFPGSEEAPSETGAEDQIYGLQFLGAHEGDAFFVSSGPVRWGGFAPPQPVLYRLAAGSDELEPLLELGTPGTVFTDRPEPGDVITSRNLLWTFGSIRVEYAPYLAAGLLPVYRLDHTVIDPSLAPSGGEIGMLGGHGGIPVEPRRDESTATVEVYDLRTPSFDEPARTFEVTESSAGYLRSSQPVYDPGLTSWVTGEPLDATEAPEAGMWLVEHDAATGALRPLHRTGRTARPAPMPLGYVGPDRDIVFISPAEGHYLHSLMLYERAEDVVREIMPLYGPPEHAYDAGAVLLGSTTL